MLFQKLEIYSEFYDEFDSGMEIILHSLLVGDKKSQRRSSHLHRHSETSRRPLHRARLNFPSPTLLFHFALCNSDDALGEVESPFTEPLAHFYAKRGKRNGSENSM